MHEGSDTQREIWVLSIILKVILNFLIPPQQISIQYQVSDNVITAPTTNESYCSIQCLTLKRRFVWKMFPRLERGSFSVDNPGFCLAIGFGLQKLVP